MMDALIKAARRPGNAPRLWRSQAREVFKQSFVQPDDSVFAEWDEEFFKLQANNGLSPAQAVTKYFEERGDVDDGQNEPL